MTYNATKQHIRDVLSGKSQVRNGEPIQTIACYLRSSQESNRISQSEQQVKSQEATSVLSWNFVIGTFSFRLRNWNSVVKPSSEGPSRLNRPREAICPRNASCPRNACCPRNASCPRKAICPRNASCPRKAYSIFNAPIPPSNPKTCPVIQLLLLLNRKVMASARSFGWPMRPSG